MFRFLGPLVLAWLAAALPAAARAGSGDALPAASLDTSVRHEGKATFYRLRGPGACALPTEDTLVAAVSRSRFAGSLLCGACLEAQGPLGSVIARIVDRCTGCPVDGIDLSRQAFAKVASPGDGHARLRWRLVPCPWDTQALLQVKGVPGRGQVALRLRHHEVPLRTVEVTTDTGWRGLPDTPWTIRLTDVYGRSATDSGIVPLPGGEIPLPRRFEGPIPLPKPTPKDGLLPEN
jgi:expansin (peptidoglycan-binding protein)